MTAQRYRAQVLSDDGMRWVDGALATTEHIAELDAARLARRYGNETRVVQVDDGDDPRPSWKVSPT